MSYENRLKQEERARFYGEVKKNIELSKVRNEFFSKGTKGKGRKPEMDNYKAYDVLFQRRQNLKKKLYEEHEFYRAEMLKKGIKIDKEI